MHRAARVKRAAGSFPGINVKIKFQYDDLRSSITARSARSDYVRTWRREGLVAVGYAAGDRLYAPSRLLRVSAERATSRRRG